MLGYHPKELKFMVISLLSNSCKHGIYVSRDRSRDEATQVTEC